MECTLHSVNLLCSDRSLNSMSSFISFLFDVEIKFDKNARFFFLDGVRFNLIECHGTFQSAYPAFELNVASPRDLSNFKQKFDLYLYKSQAAELKTSFNPSCFEFEDPSGNLWRINQSSRSNASASESTAKNSLLM